jgi:hypothetical protein
MQQPRHHRGPQSEGSGRVMSQLCLRVLEFLSWIYGAGRRICSRRSRKWRSAGHHDVDLSGTLPSLGSRLRIPSPAPDFHGISETYDWLGKKPFSLLWASQILKPGIELDRKVLSDFGAQSDISVSRETFWYDRGRNPYKTAYAALAEPCKIARKIGPKGAYGGRRKDSSVSLPSSRADCEASVAKHEDVPSAACAEKTIHRMAAEKRI